MTTSFPSSFAGTVKLWSQRTLYDFTSDTEMLGQMMKSGVIRREDQTSRMPGDQVTISFEKRLTGPGIIGMGTATGNEDSLTYFTDALLINQLRYVVQNPATGTIDYQRVTYDLPEDSYRMLSEWHKLHALLGAFNQAAGNTASTITWDGQTYAGTQRLSVTGLNAAIAPSTTSGVQRIFRPNGDATDQAVAADTSATAKLSDILAMETIAMTNLPYIRPISEMQEIKFHYYVHTQCYTDLLNDTSSPNQFRDIQQALITSGRGEGEIQRSFIFSQTRIYNSDKIPNGVDSNAGTAVANTRRNVFMGRDALVCAFGQGYTDGSEQVAGWQIKTDYHDVGNLMRISMIGVYGILKIQFNSNDNGVIVCTNYSSI